MNEMEQPIYTSGGGAYEKMVNAIRFLAADAVERAKSGHPGLPMGMADVATVLFSRFLKFDPADPTWPDRDRFVLSAGHGSMLLYALLYLTGYEDVTLTELKNFRQLGSRTAGHPEYGHAPGIETTTGPLGQGLTNAVGMALAERLLNSRFGDDIANHYTYVIAGDGCLMEGISHEAISFAGHFGLSKLIVLWDDNSVCIDGPTDLSVSDNQMERFNASGWHVQAVDGHDRKAIAKVIEMAQISNRPSFIACKTVIGYGAPNKGGTAATHGAPLGDDEIAATRENLSWPHKPFEIPDETLSAWREVGRRCGGARKAWEARRESLDPSKRDEFNRTLAGDLPARWHDDLSNLKKRFADEQPKLATRKASGEVLSVLTAVIPEMIGGSADLTGSVNTKTPSMVPIARDDFSGRYVHYGVREHAMAAIMNGMALHGGFIPYGGTFLVFTDYMRGGMRLSALMGQRVIYVLTHDSIGLGEDGPTHQPVETLAMLRATPNFCVFRPADAVETAECWALAISRTDSPSGLVLTRQGLPTLRTEHTDENLCSKGAYVLAEAEGGARVVTLLATGSEVSIAMAARESLENDGIATAVVSMPCWELFEAQEPSYRDQVLGPGTVRVGVEAAVSLGWDKYLGDRGEFVGMQGFGASAPADKLFEHFGLTADAVANKAKALLHKADN